MKRESDIQFDPAEPTNSPCRCFLHPVHASQDEKGREFFLSRCLTLNKRWAVLLRACSVEAVTRTRRTNRSNLPSRRLWAVAWVRKVRARVRAGHSPSNSLTKAGIEPVNTRLPNESPAPYGIKLRRHEEHGTRRGAMPSCHPPPELVIVQ